uniref:RQC domain-containing protein n=1 Tax=Panagrolaimus sp. JU765 TaxID=591449 RepID=A0AC34RN14_9BILA
MLVEHFGEIYDAAVCEESEFPCSICEDITRINKQYQLYDITDDAKAIIESIINMNGATISYMVEIYRGNLSRKNQDKAARQNHLQLKIYKKGSALNENDAQRIMRKLVIEGYLDEVIQSTSHGSSYGNLYASEKGLKFINGEIQPEPKVGLTIIN